MLREFMANMSEEDKIEMMRLIMPIMKDIKPQMMAEIVIDFSESDCKKMMKEMPLELREKCSKMMTDCLNTLKEM